MLPKVGEIFTSYLTRS